MNYFTIIFNITYSDIYKNLNLIRYSQNKLKHFLCLNILKFLDNAAQLTTSIYSALTSLKTKYLCSCSLKQESIDTLHLPLNEITITQKFEDSRLKYFATLR